MRLAPGGPISGIRRKAQVPLADSRQMTGNSSYGLEDSTDPREILEWATSALRRLVVTSSFQSSGLVILHMMRDIHPGIPVVFLETGFHFPETLRFRDEIVERWGLELIVLRGEHGSVGRQNEVYGPELYRRDPDRCCTINKVEPLQETLEDYDGWISGLRRDQSEGRSSVRIVQTRLLSSGRAIAKIHPLANWSRQDAESYLERHDIPTHPLLEKGYASIGCWPCTRPVADGEDERAGRWSDRDKLECGLHTFGQVDDGSGTSPH